VHEPLEKNLDLWSGVKKKDIPKNLPRDRSASSRRFERWPRNQTDRVPRRPAFALQFPQRVEHEPVCSTAQERRLLP
jgi:hypothetical protein